MKQLVFAAMLAALAACHPPAAPAQPEDSAAFMAQLRHQVSASWDPNSVWRRVDPKGTVYGPHSRVTQLRVSLSPRGELARIVVVAASGAAELDEEAIRAFRKAAPFLRPPDSMVAADHLVTFDFALYYTVHPEYAARIADRGAPSQAPTAAPGDAPAAPAAGVEPAAPRQP
jgi:TonB family protein